MALVSYVSYDPPKELTGGCFVLTAEHTQSNESKPPLEPICFAMAPDLLHPAPLILKQQEQFLVAYPQKTKKK